MRRPTAPSSRPSPSARRGAASRPQGSLIAPGGSDALPAMRQDPKPGPSMRGSLTSRSRSGRQRQPLARPGKDGAGEWVDALPNEGFRKAQFVAVRVGDVEIVLAPFRVARGKLGLQAL